MPFRFKQFTVCHDLSAHKVGVDGVLIGAWAQAPLVDNIHILDVGCGCGLIALMMSQRYPEAKIDAIDIDEKSVKEASSNVVANNHDKRIKVHAASFEGWCNTDSNRGKYDLIVSNPPYFNSGMDASLSDRMRARHCGVLSPVSLITDGTDLLTPNGRIAMIMPSWDVDTLLDKVPESLHIRRLTYVRNKATKQAKRVLIELGITVVEDVIPETLTMFEQDDTPTDPYRNLCHDFYLAF